MANTIITLTEEEIIANPFCENGIPKFYKLVMEKLGLEWGNHMIDCTKINISGHIQESWFEHWEGDKVDLAMGLCIGGPKVDKHLPWNGVEVQDGCITEEEPQ